MMKRLSFSLLLFSLGTASFAFETVDTKNNTMVLEAVSGQPLYIRYYGGKLCNSDLESVSLCGSLKELAYPFHGNRCHREEALSAIMPDGKLGLNLLVRSVSRKGWEGGEIVEISCRDDVYPFEVKSVYKSYFEENIIETWTEISNCGKKPVVLSRFDSGFLPIRVGDVWITHFYGSWGAEAQVETEPLRRELVTIKSKDGTRNANRARSEVMISLDGKPDENTGRVIGAALCWCGNYELRFDTFDGDNHYFFAGINPDNSAVSLEKNGTFVTPPLALSYSSEGMGGVSRNFHRWARNFKIHDGHRDRMILLNSWEGVHLDIRQEEMVKMIEGIADLGGELFVMDDGWFASGKYKRNSDGSALGDWSVDTDKLPDGIGHLVDVAESHGIKFGIWIEPEMVNSQSEIFEKHPDWILRQPGRDISYGRGGTRIVLDMSNPAVQDFVFKVFDDIMTANPRIAYIKWDCNEIIRNQGSLYLQNQQHTYIEYIGGLIKVLERIRAKYPDIVIQNCSSGGARVNYGIMPYFDEFWTSDQTSAHQRIRIQWGTSYFFPACAMACHISASPDLHTGMPASLKYRVDVAGSGRLGVELHPSGMTDSEKSFCRRAIEDYKSIRSVVQQGDLYRLVSPYDDKGVASLMYCSPGKDKAVFYWWKTDHYIDMRLPRVRMSGLNPAEKYKITELNREEGSKPHTFEGGSFSGKFLMEHGLEIPFDRMNPWQSIVLLLDGQTNRID